MEQTYGTDAQGQLVVMMSQFCAACQGTGKRACEPCTGVGSNPCTTCLGNFRLKAYLNLHVTWRNRESTTLTDRSNLPERLLLAVTGDTVFEFSAARVSPIKYAHSHHSNTT